jgi:hypothetical protein
VRGLWHVAQPPVGPSTASGDGRPARPADLAVCDACAVAWRRRAEDTHTAIPSTLGDWAASEAAGARTTVVGLARRIGFPLAHRHPAFRDVEPGAYREPWAYLGDDGAALAEHLAGRVVAPRPDGRLRLPAVPELVP